jgi:hypothetical protein
MKLTEVRTTFRQLRRIQDELAGQVTEHDLAEIELERDLELADHLKHYLLGTIDHADLLDRCLETEMSAADDLETRA